MDLQSKQVIQLLVTSHNENMDEKSTLWTLIRLSFTTHTGTVLFFLKCLFISQEIHIPKFDPQSFPFTQETKVTWNALLFTSYYCMHIRLHQRILKIILYVQSQLW